MSDQPAAPAPGAIHRAASRGTGRAAAAPRMTDLLRRYPRIEDGERLELIDFLKNGHPDEVAKTVYLEGMEPRVIAFKRDHPDQFSTGFKVWLPWILVLGPLVAMMIIRLI